MVIFENMTLEKTLNNLLKTNESYFHLNRGSMINIDLLKRGLMVYYNSIINFKIKNKEVNLYISDNLLYIKYLNKEKNSLGYSDFTPFIFDNNINEYNKQWVIKLCY